MGKARHILELTPAEQREFIQSFDLVISDCDGVVWHIIKPIPHTGEAINLLKRADKKCVFVSNNSVRSDEEYLKKFRAIGAENVNEDDLVHPVKAMISYLKTHKRGERVFSICSSAANDMLRSQGIDVETLEIKEHLTASALAKLCRTQHKVAAVLMDINLNLCYAQLAKAYQYLQQEDCILLSGGADPILPLLPDLTVPGFVDFLAHLSKYGHKEPIALGKPSSHLGAVVKEMFSIKEPKRCLFMGDALIQDVGFGIDCGFQTLFVLTNPNATEDMMAADEDRRPDYCVDSLADFLPLFKNIANGNDN